MANLLHASRPATFGHNLGSRNYNYTEMYGPDKPGEEAEENARVWYVYLDEAESHDADMIEGYRSILDNLLVFAALFSAVVTTFVAQTSQVLQPDNAQITVSLLVENNRLLRAAGNRTRIDAVPAASLGPESQTHSSIDVWVNGLFFTSLALSLSTALLSVLAKQWIQAYTVIVPGSAKTRALIRQFRFGGLEKYKLGDIIQSLPLVLHCSVAIFLVGLALYVSQLSRPISGIIAVITALTFLFYFGSSMIPVLDIACPYRIPFMFYPMELLWYALYTIAYTCWNLWHMLTRSLNALSIACLYRIPFVIFPTDLLWHVLYTTGYTCWNIWRILTHSLKPGKSWRPQWVPSGLLKMAEHNKVLNRSFLFNPVPFNSLGWVFNHSSNRFVKEVVIEGICGLLDEPFSRSPYRSIRRYLNSNSGTIYFLSAIKYCLSRLPDTYSASSVEDEIGKSDKYGRMIETFMKFFNLKTLLDESTAGFKDWQEQIRDALSGAYEAALRGRHHVLSRWLLDLGGPNLFPSGSKRSGMFLYLCAYHGDAEDLRQLVYQGIDLNWRDYDGRTALHIVAFAGNLDVMAFLIEREPALISAQTNFENTVLEFAIQRNLPNSHTMVTYLLDHGAQSCSHDALYRALIGFKSDVDLEKVKLLLDCGWDRTFQDAEGKTLLDIARSEGDNTLVEYLEQYQTARLAPYGMTSHTVNEETP